MMITDAIRVKQILINLISNAIKYTHHGLVSIICNNNKDDNSLDIIVQDTGIGIPEQYMRNLFTPYRKFLRKKELKRDGVGLGLAVSKSLAKALGGDILV